MLKVAAWDPDFDARDGPRGARTPARRRRPGGAGARAGPGAAGRRRLRRLPHRPAPSRRRGRGAAPAARPGSPDRRARRQGRAERLGFYGFGAAAHLIAQVAVWQERRVFAFTRAGDERTQAFARSLGAEWAGAAGDAPPEPLDAAIIFAPVGALVLDALRACDRGGMVVCAGIHMSDLPPIPYGALW